MILIYEALSECIGGDSMSKRLGRGLMMAMIMMVAFPVFAESEVSLVGDTESLVKRHGDWMGWSEEDYYVPELKLTLKDAYKYRGERQGVRLELENAYWTSNEMRTIEFRELKNIDYKDIIMNSIDDWNTTFEIQIPSDIKEGEAISMVLPMWVRAENMDTDYIKVKVIPIGDLACLQPSETLIATKPNKCMTYKVGELPTVQSEGVMADITFSETVPYALRDKEIEVKLKIDNPNFAFDAFKFIEEEEYKDTTEYVLLPNQYMKLEEGFKNAHPELRLERPKDTDSELTFKISKLEGDEKGSFTLTKLPLCSKGIDSMSGELELEIRGEEIVEEEKKVIVATLSNVKVKEDPKEEPKKEESKKEEAQKAEEEKQPLHHISFKVGQHYYEKDGKQVEMDGEVYIEAPGYAMIPVRYLMESLEISNSQLTYTQNKIHILKDGHKIMLSVGEQTAEVNGEKVQMYQAPKIKDGRSYIPLSDTSKLLGIQPSWDSKTKVITICY